MGKKLFYHMIERTNCKYCGMMLFPNMLLSAKKREKLDKLVKDLFETYNIGFYCDGCVEEKKSELNEKFGDDRDVVYFKNKLEMS